MTARTRISSSARAVRCVCPGSCCGKARTVSTISAISIGQPSGSSTSSGRSGATNSASGASENRGIIASIISPSTLNRGRQTMPRESELKMDAASLYREETFTDRRMGTIRMLTPVRTDGSIDAGRQVLYLGEAQMLTPAGTLPLVFEIDARSLGDAVEKFADAAKLAIEHTLKELQEL